MRIKLFSAAITLGLILSLCLTASTQVSAAGLTWYVDDGGSDVTGDGSSGNPWATIQHAIDDAGVTNDDTIIVGDGTYAENVTVDKELVIQSQNGAASTVLTAAAGTTIAITITADNVTITGFTISGGDLISPAISLDGDAGDHVTGCTINNNICREKVFGIILEYADNNTISANDCNGNSLGIILFDSTSNLITGNSCMNGVATEAVVSGITLNASSDNTVSDNRCNRNGNGITIESGCYNNNISNNYCADNSQMGGGWFDIVTGYGIFISGPAENNHIYGNTCGRYHDDETGTDYDENEKSGICLSDYLSDPANNNIIAGNTCNYNLQSGITLDFDENYNTGNILMGNTCNNNDRGISVSHSHYTVIFNNGLANNINYGIYVTGDDAEGNMAICNTITGNPYGIYATTDVTGSGIFIHSNNIFGNTIYGVYNQDSESNAIDINACNNWWGDASGPDDDAGGNPGGTGDKVSTYVNCGEWAENEKDVPEILTTMETTTSTTTRTSTTTSTSVSTSTQTNIQTQTEIDTVTIIITADGTITTLLVTTTVSGTTTETTSLPGSTMTFTYSSTITSTQSGTTTTTTTAVPPSVTLTTTLTITDETIDWTITIILTICGLLTGGIITAIIIRKK
jgi:parallel beta-helix repeat protein